MANPVALQMYTLRESVAEDYAGTLKAVADLGYRAVELATLGRYTARDLRAVLDGLGLQAMGIHVGFARLERELEQVLLEAGELGARYVVCASLPAEKRNPAGYQAAGQELDRTGQACQERGLQLCYHNHDFEFQIFDGTMGFDLLLNATDPALVQLELDVYWAAFAGYDPAGLIRRLAGRTLLVHLKDMTADPPRTFTEVGAGVLNIPEIVAACDESGVEWLIVEQDAFQRPPLESVRLSLAYLEGLGRS